MPEQEKKLLANNYGGTMRLGSWPCKLVQGTHVFDTYKDSSLFTRSSSLIYDRHRHRYEFNNKFLKQFLTNGLKIAGTTPDGKLVEIIELADHPFFVGTQFHPELLSRPLRPHPLFMAFVKASSSK